MSQNDIDQNQKSINNQSQEENEEEKAQRQDEEENKENEAEKKEEEEEKNEEEENKEGPKEVPFSYLEKVKNEIWLKEKDETKHFSSYKGDFKYCFCILMENNGPSNSILLKKTLKSIGDNLSKLNDDFNIAAQEIIVFIFINEIKYKNNFLDFEQLENEKEEKKEYILQEWIMNVENEKVKDLSNIKIFTINRLKYLYPIKSLNFYYSSIIRQIKKKKRILFSSILTTGITFDQNKLVELISFSYHEKKKHSVAVSSVEYHESNLISKLCIYYQKRFNIYDMNFLSQSNTIPISSQLSTITMNDEELKILIQYYKDLSDSYIKATIDYHDYNLALNLKQKNYLIKYINDNPGFIVTSENFSFYDYQQIYLERFSGYYGNFFSILSSFSNNSILQIIFSIFQLIAIGFEFILPSIASMIIYTIFYSAFKTDDYKISLFFTLLYLSLMFVSGYGSLVGKNINTMPNTYFILNILMAVLYFLSLISSIPAIHFANKDKNPDLSNYKFNKAAISTIIIFTFIPYIIPLILNISSLKGDVALLLVYNLICAPLFKINFNVAGIWGATDVSGGKAIKERKSLYLLLYLGINLFIGSLSFYNSDNKKKANCVMAFGIIYLIYNFVRTLAIIFEFFFKKEEAFDNENLKNNIKDDFNEIGEEGDINSDEGNSQNEEENDNNINNKDYENNNDDDNINNEEKKDEDGREVQIEQDDI